MRDSLKRAAVCGGLLLLIAVCFGGPGHSFAQRRQPALVCKRLVLAALKPRPELSYECGDQANDWDEKILKLPARLDAITGLMSGLSTFSDDAWWAADTVDLSVCDYTDEPRALTAEQRRDFTNGDYVFWLFGNDRIRLVLIPDPCYQTQYGGANAFLLYRHTGKVFVTQVLDGYFSRADNSVGFAFAKHNNEEIIEVATGSGGLQPTLTNYYFTVDPRTNHAVPKKLFQGRGGLTNQISSAMLFNVSRAAEPLQIVRGNTLAPNFIVYRDDGPKPARKVLRWNGNVYR
jgi:hypothetical protein